MAGPVTLKAAFAALFVGLLALWFEPGPAREPEYPALPAPDAGAGSAPGRPHTHGQLAEVTRVIDGDTIEVMLEGRTERVRYIGIDAPESVHPTQPPECYGPEAAIENSRVLKGKEVRVEKDITDRDAYGRLLRYVYADGLLVNAHLVREGFAHMVTYPPDVAHAAEYRAAQQEAREGRRGLWAACAGSSLFESESTLPPAVAAPEGCAIKGNVSEAGERIYHLPTCEYYARTVVTPARGERWFCTEAEALGSGWRKALNCP